MGFLAPALGSIIAGIGVGGGFAGAFAKVALGLGVQFGLAHLNQKKAPARHQSGVQIQVSYGADVARFACFGICGTKSQRVYDNVFGPANKTYQRALKLSDGWCDGLEEHIWLDGEKVALNPIPIPAGNTEVARYEVEGYGPAFIIRFFDGRPGQVADTELVQNANPPDRWTVTNKGVGQCYVSLSCAYDATLFKNGFPEPLFVLRGLRLHDPRKDITFGGVGTHNLNNPATWEFSQNPALIVWNLLLGVRINGYRVVGLENFSVDDADIAAIMVAANNCDELIQTPDDPAVYRYLASLIARDDTHVKAALDPVLDAKAGQLVDRGGIFYLLSGAPQVPVVTITDDDLVIDHEPEYSGTLGSKETVNAVTGTFLNAAKNWATDSYPSIENADYVAADNGNRYAVNFPLTAVSHAEQAQRVATIKLREGRFGANGTIAVRLPFIGVEAGDWIEWQSDWFEFTKTFVVENVTIPQTGGTNAQRYCQWQLREVSAQSYLVNGEDLSPIAPPPTAPGRDPGVSTVSGFFLTTTSIEGAKGQSRPRLVANWTPPDDVTIDAVIFQLRAVGYISAEQFSTTSPDEVEDGKFQLPADIMAGTNYEVRASIKTTPRRHVSWTQWSQITAEDSWAGLPDERTEELIKLVTTDDPDIKGSVIDLITDLRDRIEKLGGSVAAQTLIVDQHRRQDGSEFRARANELITTLATETEALAALVEGVEAELNGEIAAVAGALNQITAKVTDLDGVVTANAQALTGVTARVDDVSAQGLFKVEAEAGTGGAEVNLIIKASTNVNGNYSSTGLVMQVFASGETRMIFAADKFKFTTATGAVQPFSIIGDKVYATNLIVQYIASVNEKLIIDAQTNFPSIRVYD